MTVAAAHLRGATEDDVPGIVALEALSFEDAWGAAWSTPSVTAEVVAPGRIVRVARTEEGGLVGWSSTSVAGEVADLLRIAVDPGARRRGIARLLVDEVLRTASSAGADRVLLEVAEANGSARALYAATGFREIHRRPRYYPGGGTALVLQRELA